MGKVISLENKGYLNSQKMKSDELLDKALESTSLKLTLKYAKQALEVYPDNIDAENLIVEYEDNLIKKIKRQDQILEKATKLLEEQNMFISHNIGAFWGILETRPYMRARHNRILTLMELGRYSSAVKECEAMMKLCINDNLGIRYILLGLYTVLERFDECKKLYKKFNDTSLNAVLIMAIMYYKMGDYKKCKEYLKKVEEANEFALGFLLGEGVMPLDEYKNDYFSYGTEEEAFMVLNNLFYLLASAPAFIIFITEEYLKSK